MELIDQLEKDRKRAKYNHLIRMYSKNTKKHLIFVCKLEGYKGYSGRNKDDLVKFLAKAKSGLTTLEIIELAYEN